MSSPQFIAFLNQLERKNILSTKANQKIQDFLDYGYRESGQLFLVISASIGALFVSAGIFAIIAHNWDDLPKIVRGIFSIIPVGAGIFFYYQALFKHRRSVVWMEAASLFLFLMIGASIALVTSTYHIFNDDVGLFIKVWLFLALPLFYLGRASGIALLYLGLACYFVFPEIHFGFLGIPAGMDPNEDFYWFWIFVAAFMPHFIQQLDLSRSKQGFRAVYLGWVVAVLFYITLPAAFKGGWVFWALSLLLGYSMIGNRLYGDNASLFGKPFQFITFFALFYTLQSLCNARQLEGLLQLESWKKMDGFDTEQFIFYFLGLIVMIVLALKAFKVLRPLGSVYRLITYLPVLVIFLILLYHLDRYFHFDIQWLGGLVLNFFVLGFGIAALVKGANEKNMAALFYGLFLVCLLLWERYFDLSISFWFKGLLFILIGGGFFLITYIFSEEMTYEVTQRKINEDE